MTTIERSCVTYFSNAITTEKQTESSSVNISDLKIYLTSAPKSVRSHINTSHKGDLTQFLSRYPEVFQVESGNRVFLTTDVINMHGIDNLEKLAVEYFADKLRSMKAYQSTPIPVMALKRYLNEAQSGIQSLFSKHYFAKDFKKFFHNHCDVFGVSNSGNVYLLQESQVLDCDESNVPGMFSDASGIMESEVSQDENDAVNFYRRVLNSPGIELQACSIDSLFAQLCEAPSNVQRFLQKNYNEVNFLDFFNAHKEVFNISMSGQTSLNDYTRPQTPPLPSEFPPLTSEADDVSSYGSRDQYWDNSQRSAKTLDPEQEAILFYQSVVESYSLEGEEANVEKLRQHLANAPLIVFSYFHSKYPYKQFEKFFLNHASHFTIDSLGVVELSRPNLLHDSEHEREHTSPWKPTHPSGSRHSSVESATEETALPSQPRNLQCEAQLERFYWDIFQVAYGYNVRVISPGTLLAISACLNRRLTGYLAEQYGKDLAQFFQCYPNKFRVSKNGNICLAVEKECHSEAQSKKSPSELSAEFFVAILQLLQVHQVKAVPPDVLWEFLPLAPPKVNSFFSKRYEKDSCKAFFLTFPRLFAISKNKNVYLTAGSSQACGTDASDDESLEFIRASSDPCEVAAIEFFIDRVRSLKLSCYPVPLVILKESLAKASLRVRNHFEEKYLEDKFLDFFVKYKEFFFVMQPINVVWLTQMDPDDVVDESSPTHCPLSNKSRIFRQIVGVVVADLLLKSPRPFSNILGHLLSLVAQHNQELGKYPGKSKTERLCSLLTSCFNMFKIIKDNVILSWPMKHASSLILCLEEALAGVCVHIARHDTVSFRKFYSELKMKVERMFQCFILDTNTMLCFLERREEFYVLNSEQFIVITADVPDDQAEEVSSLVEKELKSRTGGINLQLLLSSIREERFQHSFTCGTIMSVVLKHKDKFYIEDGQLFLKQNPSCTEPSQVSPEPAHGPKVESFTGTGWITNMEDEGGTIAAALGSDNQYVVVNFSKSALSDILEGNIDLLVGDEVDFVAVRKGTNHEWVVTKITRSTNGEPPVKQDDAANTDAAKKAGSLPSFSGESSNEEDDGSSTNGEDRIFYSSASDVDPPMEVKSNRSLSPVSSKENVVVDYVAAGNKQPCPSVGREEESSEESENGGAKPSVSKTSLQSGSSVCSENRWSSPLDKSQIADVLGLMNTDEDETPYYDRRIVNSISSKRLERMKDLLSNPPHNSSHNPEAGAAGEGELPDVEVAASSISSQGDGDAPANSYSVMQGNKSMSPLKDNCAVDNKEDSRVAFEEQLEKWDGAGIWDVEPFVEAMEAQHLNVLKGTEGFDPAVPTEDKSPEKDWEEAEVNTVAAADVELQESGSHVIVAMDEDVETVPKEDDDTPSHRADQEASVSDSETLKLYLSREGSPDKKSSFSEELNDIDPKNVTMECPEAEHVDPRNSGGPSMSPPAKKLQYTEEPLNGNKSVVTESPEVGSAHLSADMSEEWDAGAASVLGNTDDICAECSPSESPMEAPAESAVAHAAEDQPLMNEHGAERVATVFAKVVQVDSSSLVLKINAKTVDENRLLQCLQVGDGIFIQTLQNPALPVAVPTISAEKSSGGTEESVSTKDSSAQTVSTGAILAASLLVE